MTSNLNVTSSISARATTSPLLWLPYVIIAAVCIAFLAINFWCYHRKHRQRYQRKAEHLEARERMLERRMILRMVKARYVVQLQEDDGDFSLTNNSKKSPSPEQNHKIAVVEHL